MKKSKLFILSSIVIIISLFATAAACNLCGVPIEIGEITKETGEKTETYLQNTATTHRQTQGTEAPQNTEAPLEGNRPPTIAKMEFGRLDVDVIESEGNFDAVIPGFMVSDLFTIEAYDEDGDELTYSAYDSLGTNFPCTKIDNSNAEFRWRPSLSHLGSYTLTIEVSDSKGGTDSHSINMNFVEAPSLEEPENSPPVISDNLTIMGPAGEVTDLYTNQLFRISGSVFDPDEDYPLNFSWSSGSGEFQSDTNSPTVDWKTPATAGNYEIILTVTDSRGGVSIQTYTVTVQAH